MLTLPITISLIYFGTFIFCAFLGVFAIHMNPRERINQIFFLMCLSFCVWTFSFSIYTSAPNVEAALFWMKISAFGWTTFYSFVLHFSLLLTKNDSILQKKSAYFFIYAPCLLNIYLYIFSPISSHRYRIIKNSFGYIEIGTNNITNPDFAGILFNIYYMLWVCIALIIFVRYIKKNSSMEEKKNIRILLFSFLACLVLGSLMEQIPLMSRSHFYPRMGVLSVIIPMIAFLYIIRKNGFLMPRLIDSVDTSVIMNDTRRLQLYKYVTLFFMLTAFLIFMSKYFFEKLPLESAFLSAFVVLMIALGLNILERLSINTFSKDFISTVIIAGSIPYVTLQFAKTEGISVWASPFALLLLFILLEKRWMIGIIGISGILTQIYLFIYSSEMLLRIDATDHITRILFFFVITFMTLYVRAIYSQRLRENEHQMMVQKMVSSISASFVNSGVEDMDSNINSLLEMTGKYSDADRSYIFLFSADKNTMTYSYEWCADGIYPAIDQIGTIHSCSLPWWTDNIFNEKLINIPDVSALPEEACAEKEILEKQSVKSLICFPIKTKSGVIGFMGLDSVSRIKSWNNPHQNILMVLSNLLSDAFGKLESENNIYTMAYYDQLTSLPNRFFFNEKLEKQILSLNDSLSLIGIVLLDIDSFKYINETIGHSKGDDFLREVGNRLASLLAPEDFLARFSGDEFILMLSAPQNLDDIEIVAKKIMQAFKAPIRIEKKEFFISVSMGISLYPIDGIDSQTLVKNADITMYESKRLGKNQYTFCSSMIKEVIAEKIRLTNFLHRAIEKNELLLHYQPQVSSQTRTIKGFEALLRWVHPESGIVSPGVFIPIAEQTGLIHPIGKWVLKTACLQMKKWQEEFNTKLIIAINISMKQFKDPDFVNIVGQVLSETDFPPELLEIEITESEEIEEQNNIIQILNKLKEIDVKISIDDFGTKYSSLSRLKALPIDKIKIDMQFIHGITTDSKDRGITKSIIDLAKNLHVGVIAEGVETEDQLNFLNENGCDEIQGFYFYRPMPQEEVYALLKEKFSE